jgi:hypothetical protein
MQTNIIADENASKNHTFVGCVRNRPRDGASNLPARFDSKSPMRSFQLVPPTYCEPLVSRKVPATYCGF